MSEWVVRFSRRQRFEHFSIMTLFTLLAITGFPQKFHEQAWASVVVGLCGGLDVTRFLHRMAGILFALLTASHLAVTVFLVATGRTAPTLVPKKKDFTDAIHQLRYYLGLEPHGAKFDRFDYRQKFEYWGLVMGGSVMIATGFVLYFPIVLAKLLPGELIPVAKVAHSNEGLLALLVVTVWHIFNAHLSPEVFPFDKAIFTGKVSRERMLHEHPLELARIEGRDPASLGAPGAGGGAPPAGPGPGHA